MSLNLPREVFKWIQGLDLSYSIVDYKRDLNSNLILKLNNNNNCLINLKRCLFDLKYKN